MSVIQTTFDEMLNASEGVAAVASIESIIMGNIAGALAVHKANEKNDRSGTDWWVEHVAGRHLSVDAKVRDEDWRAKDEKFDDLALETWSVVEKKKVGWTRDENKRCDYILWLWKDTGRWCMLPFPMLCTVFSDNWQEWREKYKNAQQFTKDHGGYHSECVFVPRRDVWAEIYKRFG